MNDYEIDERVAKIRASSHNRWHYRDANSNRRCGDCTAFVRAQPGWVTVQLRELIER